jgi:hypothetical protein
MPDTVSKIAANTRNAFSANLAPAQLAAVAAGALYVTGYYVNSVFVQNFGIISSELVRLEYIKIGFMFWLLCVTIILLPTILGLLTYKIRKSSNFKWFWSGFIFNLICSTAFIGIPCILSIFATDTQWTATYINPILGLVEFKMTILASILSGAIGVIIFPAIERKIYPNPTNNRQMFYQIAVVEIPRGIAAISAVFFAADAFLGSAWPENFLFRITPFLAVACTFGILVFAAILWTKKIKDASGSAYLIPIFLGGGTVFYYLLVTSFVHGAYPLIPSNRGGKLPLSASYLILENPAMIPGSKINIDNMDFHGPYIVVDDNRDHLYLSLRLFPNNQGDFPATYRIPKEKIKLQLNIRLNQDLKSRLQH